MPSSRLAQLLLPSGTLGSRAYDVLEEAVFLGPGKQGLTAAALPFPKATAALTWDGVGFVIRALPGEATPEVNGEPANGRRLADGDRIGLLGESVLVHVDTPPPPTAASGADAPARAAAARRSGPRRLVQPRAGLNHLTWIAGLLGLALLLVAGIQTVERLGVVRDATRLKSLALPDPPGPPVGDEERIVREHMQAETYEREHLGDPSSALATWQDFLKRHAAAAGTPPSAYVLAAAARMEALHEAVAQRAWDALETQVKNWLQTQRYASALEALRGFETKYGATPRAADVAPLRADIARAARAALDALKAKVEPLLTSAPRQAHAALLSSGLELPPDLGSEVSALLELTVANMRRRGAGPGDGKVRKVGDPDAPGERPPDRPRPPPAPSEGPGPVPPVPGLGPEVKPPPVPPAPPAVPPAEQAEAARAAWRAAREHLLAGRAKEALAGYDALLQAFGSTAVVKANVKRVEAGRLAARAALEGPRALLSVKSTGTKERLELEYGFDDPNVLQRDFSVEKPFASDLPVDGTTDGGEVVLKGATGLMHVLVFAPDVRVEADVTAVIAKDFGALAVEESDRFRCVMLNCANTRFKLKKGDAAKVQPGHVLWFMGEGVWSGADPGEHGFIKIAERTTSKVLNGDRMKLEFVRKADKAEGGFEGRTDGVFLEGAVRGDDGGKMGAARVGLFTNGGEVRIRTVKISGVVDRGWWAKRVAELPSGDPGPD